MKKVLIGLAIGTTVCCLIRKMHKDGHLDCLCDSAQDLFNKSKSNLSNLANRARHEGESIKDRLDDMVDKK